MNKEHREIITKSSYGICTDEGLLSDELLYSSGNFAAMRTVTNLPKGLHLNLSIENQSQNSIRVFSFIVADFVLPFKVREVLEHGWLQCSDSRYKSLSKKTHRNEYFLVRDQNPFSFKGEYGYLEGSIVSEWFTVLRSNKSALIIGASTTAKQFTQVYMLDTPEGIRVRVTCQYDGLEIKPDETIDSEEVTFLLGDENKCLKIFAENCAKKMQVKSVCSSINAVCCSYYWNGNYVTEGILKKELSALKDQGLDAVIDFVQIDAGYTKYFGDWLDFEGRFPSGLDKVVGEIRNAGMEAGIWISPFAIDPRTAQYKNNQSWFIQEGSSLPIPGRQTTPFDEMFESLQLLACDPTDREFQENLVRVFDYFVRAGFRLFKLDFLYPVCLAESFSSKVTRVEALRKGLQIIRDLLPEDSLILSAISPLSPLVGLVDSARIGNDTLSPQVSKIPVLNSVVNNKMIEQNLRLSSIRAFMHNILWSNDIDVLVFRKHTGISRKYIEEQKKLVRRYSLSAWIGDSIYQLDKDETQNLSAFLETL